MNDPSPISTQPNSPPNGDKSPRTHRPSFLSEDLAYILPMAVFLLFTWAGVQWPSFFPASYIAKTILAAALLIYLRPFYTRIRWNHWWLGVIMGVLGIVQWVGMEKLLLHFWPHFPEIAGEPRDLTKVFASPAVAWSFIALRWAGAALVVPFMEELFWRDFCWRSIIAPNDFKLAAVGEWDWKAFVIVPLIFAVVHGNWWLTAIGWGFMVGGLLAYTKSLGACIIAHATTNLLLGVYVLYSKQWSLW